MTKKEEKKTLVELLGASVPLKPLGGVLRRLRESRSWSQEELGVRLGSALHTELVGGSTISRYESGERNPHYQTVRGLERVFGLVDYVLAELM